MTILECFKQKYWFNLEYSALCVPPIRNRILLVRDSVPPCFRCYNPRDDVTNPYNDTDLKKKASGKVKEDYDKNKAKKKKHKE